MKRILRWVSLLLVVAVAFGVGWAWPVLVRPPLVLGQDAVSDPATAAVTPVLGDVGGRVIVTEPPSGVKVAPVLVVLYPGGLVRPQAYEWLARALAVQGYGSVIPEFSFDLAITDPGRAGALIERYAAGRKVVLAGHSLGGAMAAQYLAGELRAGREPAAGLVLLGAYPPAGNDLSTAKLKALSLRGEFDGLADAAEVEAGLKLLPPDAELVTIAGGVHSFFGRYGPQAEDGVPTVSRATAEASIVAAIVGLLEDL